MADVAFLTATRISPSIQGKKLTTPKVVQVPVNQIDKIITNPDGGCIIKLVEGSRVSTQYEVAESQAQVNVAVDPVSTNPYAQDKALTVAAAGANQGAATALTAYLNLVTTATGGSAEGVRLPVASGSKPFVVINNTAVTLKVYPATSGTINSGTVNVHVTLAPGARLHFVADGLINWKTATE